MAIIWESAPPKESWHAFWETLKNIVRDPSGFYAEVAKGSGLLRPWIFSTVILFIALLLTALYQSGLDAFKSADLMNSMIRLPLALIFVLFGVAVMTPIVSIVATFLQTVIFHVCLIIVGGKTKDILSTARVVCYAGAPNLLVVVPVIGWLAAEIWGLYLIIVGLKTVHETTLGKAAFAVILPALLCFGGIFLVLVMIGGGIFAAFLKGGVL